jgi:hypothetical protein
VHFGSREAHKPWFDQNEALYRPGGNAVSKLEQETHDNIRSLYSAEMKVAEVDRWIFSTPIYDMLQRPMIYQVQWVAQYTNLKLRCAKEFKDRNSINLADIWTYYKANPPGSPTPIRTPLQPKKTEKKSQIEGNSARTFLRNNDFTNNKVKARRKIESKARQTQGRQKAQKIQA